MPSIFPIQTGQVNDSDGMPKRPQDLHPLWHASTNGHVVVYASRRIFAITWLFVLSLRCICISFLVSMSQMNAFLAKEEMEYYAELVTPGSTRLFTLTAWGYRVLIVAHGFCLVKTLAVSMYSKSLMFHWPNYNLITGSSFNYYQGRYRCKCFWRFYSWLSNQLSWFGVESPYFQWRFLLQECFEMASQTKQAYSSSILIGRLWINQLYVAIIFINSWSTPVIQHFTHHSPALQRLMCFTADAALNMISGIVLPLILIVPYYQSFDTSTYYFEGNFVYDDVWFANLVMEARQVFPNNSLDFIMKLLSHLSIYASLVTIETLLKSKSATIEDDRPNEEAVEDDKRASCPSTDLKSLGLFQRMQQQQLGQRQAILLHLLFILWGLVVITIHLLGVYGTEISSLSDDGHILGCHQRLYPWFTSKLACSVYDYNCYQQASTTSLNNSLNFLDHKSIMVLTISHCPELVMPQVIQAFPQLLGINVWNSTIVDWSQEAAITQQIHSSIIYVCLVFTSMTSIPDGLLSNDLPVSLTDIEIVYSHIASFPDDLDIKWRHVKSLYIEHCGLLAVPEVLTNMDIPDLSFVGNQLTVFPSSAGGYNSLLLSNNPLAVLPDIFENVSGLAVLGVEKTQIVGFPDWVFAAMETGTHVIAFGTPFCENQTPEDREHKYGAMAPLTCSNVNPRINGQYPVEAMMALRLP